MTVNPDPATPGLVVPAHVVAAAFGIPHPSPDQLERVTDAILDAQADVEGYLNRPLATVDVTLAGIYPVVGVSTLDHHSSWPDAQQFDEDVAVLSRVAHPDGSYDVTFRVGFDAANTRPVVRYVKVHAVRTLAEDAAYGFEPQRVVNSLSADGQSLTFEARPSVDGAAGSIPKLASLRRYRRLSVFRRPRPAGALWPNHGRRI